MEEAQTFNTNTETSREITDSTPPIPTDIYSSLKSQCDALGISISKLCRKADVDRSVLERWRHGDPKSIKTYNALVAALNKIKSSNQ